MGDLLPDQRGAGQDVRRRSVDPHRAGAALPVHSLRLRHCVQRRVHRRRHLGACGVPAHRDALGHRGRELLCARPGAHCIRHHYHHGHHGCRVCAGAGVHTAGHTDEAEGQVRAYGGAGDGEYSGYCVGGEVSVCAVLQRD